MRPLMMVNARWQFVLMYTAPAQAMAEAVEGVTDALLDRAIQAAATPDFHCTTSRWRKQRRPRGGASA